jgi:hypothetical protein
MALDYELEAAEARAEDDADRALDRCAAGLGALHVEFRL